MAKYRVGYKNRDGKKKAFRFESDKSFRSYGRSYSQGILGLGNPFTNDLMDAAVEQGVEAVASNYRAIDFIENMDTGERKWYL